MFSPKQAQRSVSSFFVIEAGKIYPSTFQISDGLEIKVMHWA